MSNNSRLLSADRVKSESRNELNNANVNISTCNSINRANPIELTPPRKERSLSK